MEKQAFDQKDNMKLAVSSVIFAVFALSFGDAVVKSLSVSFTIWQIYVVRSLIAVSILIVIFRVGDPPKTVMPISIGWTAIRSLLLAAMWVAYYAALPHIELSVAAAVYYTIPLFITLFSALFVGDRIHFKSWFAILLGFLGVVVMMRPEMHSFNYYSLLPLIAAVLYALAMILTRTKCLHENPKVLSLALNMTFILIGGLATLVLIVWSPGDKIVELNPFLLGSWSTLNTTEWLAMTVLGIVVVIGSVLAAVAYQNGPPATIASFDYCYLAFSVLWGFVFFVEIPDMLTITGMAMIAAGGLLAVRN